MLKMNYSNLKKKNWEQIVKECGRRAIHAYTDYPAQKRPIEDLIGEIIAHDAYYEGRNDAMREIPIPAPELVEVKIREPEKREKYRLIDEYHGESYFLELTDSQINFYHWLENQSLLNGDVTIEKLDEMEFEAP